MSNRAAFLAAIRDHPQDAAPTLVYADWLDENGEADRAELLRLYCAIESGQVNDADVYWRVWELEKAVRSRTVAELCRMGALIKGPFGLYLFQGLLKLWGHVASHLLAEEPIRVVRFYGYVTLGQVEASEREWPQVREWRYELAGTDEYVVSLADADPVSEGDIIYADNNGLATTKQRAGQRPVGIALSSSGGDGPMTIRVNTFGHGGVIVRSASPAAAGPVDPVGPEPTSEEPPV